MAGDRDAEDVAVVREDGGGAGRGDPGVTAGALGVHEGHAVPDGRAQGAGAVRPVGGDRPVGPVVGLRVRRVQPAEADGEVGLVGVLVLAPLPDDRGRGRVADLQSTGGRLVGQRVSVHRGGVRVVAVPLVGERGPPVVGGDRLALRRRRDLGRDGGAGVGGGAGGAGGPTVGVTAGTCGDGGGCRRGRGRSQTHGGQGDGQDRRRCGSGEGGLHGLHLVTWGTESNLRALSRVTERKTFETSVSIELTH